MSPRVTKSSRETVILDATIKTGRCGDQDETTIRTSTDNPTTVNRAPDTVATHTLAAFCGTLASTGQSATGNPCRVDILSGPNAHAPPAAAITQCLTWALAPQRAQVRCWGVTGMPIALCGHGLLSCAHTWLARWQAVGTLVMGHTEVQCQAAGPLVWLQFPLVDIATVTTDPRLAALLDAQPLACAHVGAADGYLIVELAPDFPLESIAAPGQRLQAITDRALIVTCASSTGLADADALIHCRYFAPQHGSAEDTATGSAMRILAQYWRAAGLGPRLVAYQCSPGGGLLYSAVEDNAVWIGGKVIDQDQHND